MAKKKSGQAKQRATEFPKPQGVEGEGDRFVPPDRRDQLDADPDDRAQEVVVKDLAANIQILEPDAAGRDGDEDGDEPDRRGGDDEDDAPTRSEGDDDDEGSGSRRQQRSSARGNGKSARQIRARINRERALKDQANIRATNAVRRAENVEARLAKIERAQLDVNNNVGVKDLEQKIATLKGELAKAVEKGETQEQMDLTIKLGDAQADLKLLKYDLKRKQDDATAEEARAKKEREAADASGGDAGGDDEPAPTTQEWMAANRAWFSKVRFKEAKADAIALDKEILAEIADGEVDFEQYSEEHFEELNTRLAALHPDLPINSLDGEPFEAAGDDDEEDENVGTRNNDRGGDRRTARTPVNGRRPPVGGSGQRSNGRKQVSEVELAKQGKVRLDESDFKQMRMYGLDPKDPKQKERFARERMRSILTQDKRDQNGTGRGAR